MYKEAMRYALELGWHVFPIHTVSEDGRCSCGKDDCERPGKHPVMYNGQNAASVDPVTIAQMWSYVPDANIGIATGPSRLCVIDLDDDEGAEEAMGHLSENYWHTALSLTGGGGRHFVYRAPDGAMLRSTQRMFKFEDGRTDEAGRPLWLPFEFKAQGGQFTAPPSRHKSGKRYEWHTSPFDVKLAALPANVWERAEQLEKERKERQAKAREARKTFTDDRPEYADVADAILFVPQPPDGPAGYEEWLETLMAVHSEFPGNDGVALVESWCPGYAGEVEQKFASFNTNGGITIATLFRKAMDAGWQPPRRSKPKPLSAPQSVPDDPDDMLDPTSSSVPTEAAEMAEPGDVGGIRWMSDYIEEGGAMWHVEGEDKEGNLKLKKVADFVATITREVVNEDGSKAYLVEGSPIRGADFAVEVDGLDFGQPRKLSAIMDQAAGSMAGVVPTMSGHVGRAIKHLTRQVTIERQYARIGWDHKRRRYLIPGREENGVRIDLGQNQLGAYAMPADANLQKGLDGLHGLIESKPPAQAMIALTAALGAPLVRLAGVPRYGIFIRGRTGSHKTEFCKALMTLFGPGFAEESSLIKFGSTMNSLVYMAASASDAPLFLDNFKPNTTSNTAFVSLIHMVMEGREKSRMTADMGLRDSREINTMPIITGEDLPDDDAATIARMLVLEFMPFDDAYNEPLGVAQENAYHMSAVGWSWLEWLMGDGRELAKSALADFGALRKRWHEALVRSRKDAPNTLRLAANLAANEYTYKLAMQHPVLGPIFAKYQNEYLRGMAELASYMADRTAESMESVRFVEYVKAMEFDRSIIIQDVPEPGPVEQEKLVGYRDAEIVYLHMKNTIKHIRRQFGPDALNGLTSTQIQDQLWSMGLTLFKRSKQKTIGGSSFYGLHLRRDKFDAYSGEPTVPTVQEIMQMDDSEVAEELDI